MLEKEKENRGKDRLKTFNESLTFTSRNSSRVTVFESFGLRPQTFPFKDADKAETMCSEGLYHRPTQNNDRIMYEGQMSV